MKIQLMLNHVRRTVDIDGDTPLLWVLRDELRMTGTKFGCGAGLCGACTVQVEGAAVRSCITPVASVANKRVLTIEAMRNDSLGKLVQKAWIEHDVVQCGYCQSGQVMAATALLRSNRQPSDAAIDAAMAGNLCRCGTYQRIRAAIRAAANHLRKGASGEA